MAESVHIFVRERIPALLCALIICFACCAVTLEAAAEPTLYKVDYEGGTLGEFGPGEHMEVSLNRGRLLVVHEDVTIVNVPSLAITNVVCGQDLRGVAETLPVTQVQKGLDTYLSLPLSKRYFVGLRWSGEGHTGTALFRVRKSHYEAMFSEILHASGKDAAHTELAAASRHQ